MAIETLKSDEFPKFSLSKKLFEQNFQKTTFISPTASMILGVHPIFFTYILPWLLTTEKSQNISD